jgi:hypothetical protein
MAAADAFLKLRGSGVQPAVARAQDNIAATVNPVVSAVNKTPIGGAAAPSWQPLALLGGFAPVTGRSTTAYHVDALKYVHFKTGVANAAGCVANTTLATMPAGTWPKETACFSVRGTGSTAQFITVSSKGVVSVDVAVAAGGTVDGYFSYLAEQ